MVRLRRPDNPPRWELTPLLDVVFLLLTFFIFSVATMIRADLLMVDFLPLAASDASAPAPVEQVQSVTIDRNGDLFFNKQKVTAEELNNHLADLRRKYGPVRVYVAAEIDGTADRLPISWKVEEYVHKHGLQLVRVGQPKRNP